ncbi:MAG: 3-methyl-2-oxobutanoate hydroxymethyltransferase, partial [Qingshengfaniella sp.]
LALNSGEWFFLFVIADRLSHQATHLKHWSEFPRPTLVLAVGKTANEAAKLYAHARKLEEIGVFAAELEVVPDRVAKFLTENTNLVMLGMGAGKYADAQYLFTEDVCNYGVNHKPRHGKVYRDLGTKLREIQDERIAAFKDFKADVDNGGYPEAGHSVPIADDEFEAFMKAVK